MAWLDKKQCKQFVKIAVATKGEPIAENPEGDMLVLIRRRANLGVFSET